MSKDFVWNEFQAEQVRYENEEAMRKQIANMTATTDVYRGWIPVMQSRARQFDRIAATTDSPTVRARAIRSAASLREQIALTERAISDINRATSDLERAIQATNDHFRRMHRDAQVIDRDYALGIQTVDSGIDAYITKIQTLRNSFREDGFASEWVINLIAGGSLWSDSLQNIEVYASAVMSLQGQGIPVGRYLTSIGRPRSGGHVRAINRGESRLSLSRQGASQSATNVGRVTKPLSMLLYTMEHFHKHGDEGRAIAFATYMLSGSAIAGYIGTNVIVGKSTGTVVGATLGGTTVLKVATGVAIKIVPLGVVIVAGAGLYWLYHNNDWVRVRVDAFGDFINDRISDPVPEYRRGHACVGRAYRHSPRTDF